MMCIVTKRLTDVYPVLLLQVITAVAAIEFSTRYSKACCKLMVDSSGVSALLAFMRSCNRSKPHVEMLGHALACLANICRSGQLYSLQLCAVTVASFTGLLVAHVPGRHC